MIDIQLPPLLEVQRANPGEYHKSLLTYACKANGISLDILGIGEKWGRIKQKIAVYLDDVKGLAPDEIVVCCDRRDMIIPSKPGEC